MLVSKKLEELNGEVSKGGSPQPLNLLAYHLESFGKTSSFSFHGIFLMKRHFEKDSLFFSLENLWTLFSSSHPLFGPSFQVLQQNGSLVPFSLYLPP
jgi:hypothetical protein